MKFKFKSIILALSILTLIISPTISLADAAEGDVIITLGENLTAEQREKVLNELNAPKEAQIITVSNKEEHDYLGEYIPKAQIGTRAISSSSVTLGAKDSGVSVSTNNIQWVTDDMYINALMTAGVKDAAIEITSPVPVSGTAALTGIIKAYEIQTDQVIPEDVKKVANEEMVQTAKLSDKVGAEKAAELMTRVKEEIAKNEPQTEEDLRALIERIAKELGITLTDAELDALVDFFNKLKSMNIDWNQVKDQLAITKDKVATYLQSEEGQSFLQKLKDFLQSLLDAIRSIFGS
ncbi:DUF1002 domain-containing protein [Metabacillus iocasae]|uniref:Uncharacterized protein YpuA (DUF1002 family) n=1 Tax=Priestia iocasae TaxID=2291674 RepID=A0ABS2QQD2_9BACI|nr:DUF1002 domain-containing protein [Metabacillus iocasae]MBM7701666.1 uncharacterized protein YpuA (DUF1002 family) [Metabacillus iocasae]